MLYLVRTNLALWFLQLVILTLGFWFGLGINNIFIPTYLLLINYLISFIIVNKYSYNQLNLSNFFLIGIGFLLLGRIIAWILEPSISSFRELFCLDTFFNYCMNDSEIVNIIQFINISIVAFNFGFVISFTTERQHEGYFINRSLDNSYKLLIPVMLLVGLYLLYNTIKQVMLTMSSGYLALYASQAELYEPPIASILKSLYLGYLAYLFAFKDKSYNNKIFWVLFTLFVFAMFLRILTGSRSLTIATIILLIWVLYGSKKISYMGYSLFLLVSLALTNLINIFAQISGARQFETRSAIISSIADMFYSQGITLLVLNSSMESTELPPILGYFKTLLPGIQIFYSFFGIKEKYLIDWSSNMLYFKDKELYDRGFGLGWSVFSDFYYLSFKIIIIYILVVAIWGILINYISSNRKIYFKGLLFVMVSHIFSLPRDSISPLIFSCMMYSLIFFYFTKKKVNI